MKKKRRAFSTAKFIPASFLIVIAIGTFLLSLPCASVSGESDFLTALFTATTSVCVTGLVVVDTYLYWSLFGKIVILILIQIGGLGIIALISSVVLFLGRRMSLKTRIRVQDSFGLDSIQGVMPFLKRVVIGTFCVELLGALLYMPEFIRRFGAKGIWYAIFNSISAFCNAGIDIMGPDSLIGFNDSSFILMVTSFLIIMGGLGFVVWWNLLDTFKEVIKKKISPKDYLRRLNTHSKVVLLSTFLLLLSGAVLTFILEYSNVDTIGNMNLWDKISNSLFQSVTLRTAGFAAISQGALRESTVMASILFMLIGGSPVGTAGGIKTVSAAVMIATMLSVVKGREEVTVFRKKIDDSLVKRALAVGIISLLIFFSFTVVLLVTNEVSITDAIFEVGSAIATVGLSRGITGDLNVYGKLLIIVSMYLGRIGPISMFIAFSNKFAEGNNLHYSKAKLIVG